MIRLCVSAGFSNTLTVICMSLVTAPPSLRLFIGGCSGRGHPTVEDPALRDPWFKPWEGNISWVGVGRRRGAFLVEEVTHTQTRRPVL